MTGYDTSRLHAGWHDDYERGRPGWPAQALDVAHVPRGATVLDLGAGTGKLTRLLLQRFAQVVAVEPDDGMLRLLAPLCPEGSVLAGTAEAIPLADDSVDAVFAAEAFHRFEGERSLAEIARVLKPGGALVLLWNLPVGVDHPEVAAAVDLLTRRAPHDVGHEPADLNTHRYSSGEWRRPFVRSPFTELEEAQLENTQAIDQEGLLAFFGSMGWISELAGAERAALTAEVSSLLTQPWYRRTWETHVHWTRLLG